MRPKQLMDTTDNSKEYKNLRRYYIALKVGDCPICHPHRGENRERWQFAKSWKHRTKRRKQWQKGLDKHRKVWYN